MLGLTELIFVFFPIVIFLGVAIFIVIFLVLLVRAVEKIANKIDTTPQYDHEKRKKKI